jgi:hypothetical protein
MVSGYDVGWRSVEVTGGIAEKISQLASCQSWARFATVKRSKTNTATQVVISVGRV